MRINFNEQWVDFNFGRVKFGLRGGELRLKLENGRMTAESRSEALKKFPESKVIVERQVAGKDEDKTQMEGSVTLKVGIKRVEENRQEKSISDKFQFEMTQISHKGADNKPVWVFDNKMGEPVWIKELAGSLGEMLIEDKDISWRVEATFATEMRQVVIRGLENLFSEDIHKQSIFRAKLAKLILNHKMKPYLSRQVLKFNSLGHGVAHGAARMTWYAYAGAFYGDPHADFIREAEELYQRIRFLGY